MRATNHDEPAEGGPDKLEPEREQSEREKREKEKRETTAREKSEADEDINQASEDSFPASDPPPWNSSTT